MLRIEWLDIIYNYGVVLKLSAMIDVPMDDCLYFSVYFMFEKACNLCFFWIKSMKQLYNFINQFTGGHS